MIKTLVPSSIPTPTNVKRNRIVLDECVIQFKKDHKKKAWEKIYLDRTLPENLEEDHNGCDEGDDDRKIETN